VQKGVAASKRLRTTGIERHRHTEEQSIYSTGQNQVERMKNKRQRNK
jgi:hypothetical protein